MNFLEKIKPHLTSDDYLIQETVLHALHDYPHVPEEWTVELLKEAVRNPEKETSILIYVDHQTINEEALNILIENIPHMNKSHLAVGLLEQLEPELALKHRSQLETYISKEKWDTYELLVNGTEEQVYSEYAKTIELLENGTSYNHELYKKAKNLAKCLVQNNWITEDAIDLILEEELKEDWFSFVGILAVYMVGLLKHNKHIPLLASLLVRDEDILLEEAAAALIGFQSDEVVKEVEPYLLNPHSVIFATSVVENIKTDLAVQVLREAYRNTEDESDQDLIFEALCHQLSKEALPEITKHMEKEFFTNMVDIEQVAYGYFSILEESHPDLELWKEAAMEQEMHYREQERMPQSGLFNQTPIRNENKVGRNDPCSCGSGKKYKKCCGK